MSKKTLAVVLSKLKGFSAPSTALEQYATPSELAAEVLWDAHLRGLIKDRKVLDVCAGNGIFGIGALILGAEEVVFVDNDPRMEKLIDDNLAHVREEFEISNNTSFLLHDATTPLPLSADIIFTNPPFGTKQEHVDTEILLQAARSSSHLYSFHKSTTKDFIISFMSKMGFHVQNTFSMTFSLKATMPQHTKKSHPVLVSCWHFTRTKDL